VRLSDIPEPGKPTIIRLNFKIKLQYSLCFVKSNQLKQIFGGNQIKIGYSNFFRVKENNLVAG
jgi:hypothetical protein